MKKLTKTLALLAIVAFLFVAVGCTNNKNTNINNPIIEPKSNDGGMLPSEVVGAYMSFTLGSIPSATVDYDQAKKYLSDDLKAQFVNPMFVPASYCIQDGPDDVRIVSDEIGASAVEVIIEGQYGGDWQEMWQFSLVPDGELSWLISKITCLDK